MNISKYHHISFDLDGTLIDSLPVMETAWMETINKLHITTPFELYKKNIGLPFKSILNNLHLTEMFDEISKIYFKSTHENIDKIQLYKGVYELIDKIKDSDKSISIITSKPRRNAEAIINKFNLNIDFLVAGDDTEYGKPFHDPFLLLKKYSIECTEKTIYFGDTVNDLIFSVNSKIDYCHCNYGIEGPLSKFILPSPVNINSLTEVKL